MKNSYLWPSKTQNIAMKNTKFFFVLAISVLFIFATSCNNDEGNENNNGPDSNEISQNNENLEEKDFELPKELTYTRLGEGFLYDKLFPIGWSKDGKFAYITEPADEASGMYWFEIIILDIVNDKVYWSWKPDESEEGDLQTIWKENYDLFAKHLNKAEIAQTKNFELKQPKSSYKGNDYETVLETKTETDADFGFEVVREVQIKFISPELGEKTFYNQKTDPLSYVVSAYTPGYLLSPYDDRVVVICTKERPGYEGPPNVVYFELIGSDLIRGFKKDSGG